MPTGWTERERGFEAKFAQDAEFRFRVGARRDRLFAEWAAQRLRLPGEATQALIREVLAIPGQSGHDDAVLRRIAEAFAARGEAAPGDLAQALLGCERAAREQIAAKAAGSGEA